MKKRWIAAYIFVFCSIMIVVSFLYWDIALTKYCRTLNPTIKNIADLITTFEIATWYIVISFILYSFFRFIYKNKLNTARSIFVFLSLSIAGILTTLLKWIAGRHRPIDLFNHGIYGFGYFGVGYEVTSFPSGHAQTAFTLAVIGILCTLAVKYYFDRKQI